jgi:hypothetical protein
MRNLDLNAYGVCEMTQEEMNATNGGGWFGNAVAVVSAVCVAFAVPLCPLAGIALFAGWMAGGMANAWDF